ncbi:hypothetical protein HMPREF1529_00534 [Microbacterium sp. oral taxon 186 str. F0373]|uniref:Ig-like domain-containing protein n=1 Tax=Microbacterium sp. oral taxon 186 TaxID=712383 RepID=UPI00034E3E2F|nr:Ig-like domain-containing protein [Microbacterium sp. oral taxon 186]EPD86482.1 hypothetical protein HMPREF1529_00534 [Microbacterium sp. oral taxon 186 str. F0373]
MKRGSVVGLAAAGAALALITGVSVVWPGLDAQRTPPQQTTAWVLQADTLRYARVNTAIGEIDTVRAVSNPSRIVTSADGAYMFTDNDAKVERIDDAAPVDLDAEGLRSATPAPAGTADIDASGDVVAYRTDAGAVFAGRLSAGPAAPIEVPASAAVASSSSGVVFSYSAAAGTVSRIDLASGRVAATDTVAATVERPVLTAAGDDWVLLDTAGSGAGRFWTSRGQGAVSLTGAVAVSRAAVDGDAVYVADDTGLVRIAVSGVAGERIFGDSTTSRGTPARPVSRGGVVSAAWLAEGTRGGTLWTSTGGDVPLDYGGQGLGSQRRPVFVDAGDGVILNDARSGWVWSVPDGRLLPSSQNWNIEDEVQTAPKTSDQKPPPIIDPRPPVAENDVFGVRPGALVSLPVLLNDHDPNDDVLAVDPASVAGLDPAFGTVTTTDDRQRLAVRVAPGATGSATFTYAVTDGTTVNGLVSPPATVTLRVAAEDENSAPVWCGVEGCRQDWPSPEVAPGGTVTVPVLGDWVDPQGDPVLLLSASDDSGLGEVATTPEGDVVFQHRDAGVDGEQTESITVTVADVRGATATRQLVVRIRGDAQPALQSFAVVDVAGSRVSVDVAPHVTGTAGDLTLTAARVLDDAAATATVVGGSTTFDVVAASPGAYRVAVTVSSGGHEATGTVRLTLLDPAGPADLSTSPVVAFVRPQADATVDVLAAVTNPTRRVLLLSDLVIRPVTGASLSADVVAQSQLRVSGSTASGESGLLGTVSYRVGDGTTDEGSAVTGEATVYLLPPASEQAPIAVDDRAIVRAGAQIDIPVLDNDVAAVGTRPRLDPESIVASRPDVLAFAAGDVLRVLAPASPGDLTISYRAFTTGAPALGDTATVHLSVVGDGANRDPQPRALSGRVLSGLSTVIAFDGFGMDPDGDVVRLDRIVDQPAHGSAVISADGASIVYSSDAGSSGQDTFTYRVVDPSGASGVGTVRVGVLSGDASPAPITYTDYVQVQAGDGNVLRVHPLANDIDPMQGTLTLQRVRPDVPQFALDGSPTAEFTRLQQRLVAQSDDTVTIEAGPTPGTMSFLYDVVSSAGNTARGLIVVRVVAQRVADFPVVSDTVLDADGRADLARGIDVLAGKVLWSGGDAGELSVGLWGTADGITVEGTRLVGTVDDRAHLIPFSVTGQTPAGPVTTYAFLRIPAAADTPLALRAGAPPLTVGENAQADVDLASLVTVPRGRTLELSGETRASGARPGASCTAVGATTLRYTAGADAPWTDTCRVLVRLTGQPSWTVLSIPVVVTPIAPQPRLSPAALEVAPGDTQVFDLGAMTTWQGRPEAIVYRVEGNPASFDLALQGAQLSIRGRDAAAPGTIESVVVQVTSHPGVAPARISLRVGAAPSTLPQGGSVQQQCSQASGTSCTIDVVGAAGEVNPLPSTPLQVVSVAAAGVCTGVSFAVVSPSRISATWTSDAPGATCAASFTVRDAQGRQSASARDGRILLDLQGYPKAPASVAQSAYADGSLTLRVDPGPAQAAYPALTGFEVRQAGQRVAVCTPQGICPPISAPNGEQRSYEAVAVNAVGSSLTAVRTTAWAYDPPSAPTGATAAPVVAGADGGVASLVISGVDAANTGSLQITSPVGETQTIAVGATQTDITVPAFRVGANTATEVTITPLSRYTAPPGLPGPAIGSTTVSAHGIGAPTQGALTLTAVNVGGGRVDITAVGTAAPGGDDARVRYGIVRLDGPVGQDGAPVSADSCRTSDDGGQRVFRGLPDGRLYTFALCAESWFDSRSFGRATVTNTVRATQSGAAPTGYTFVVGPTAHVAGDGTPSGRATWTIDQTPTSPETPPNDNNVVFRGLPSSVFDNDPQIQVRYEHKDGWWQSAWGDVTPAAGSAPYQVQASWSLGTCTGGTTLSRTASSSGSDAAVTFDPAAIRYYDKNDTLLAPGTDPWTVPANAARVAGIRVVVDWSGQGWSLAPASAELATRCTPAAAPNPAG